jgi:CubicO group peptidase (beta-lactamase class C family)
MRLVEAGELSLDDPAADHLPPDLGSIIEHVTAAWCEGQLQRHGQARVS